MRRIMPGLWALYSPYGEYEEYKTENFWVMVHLLNFDWEKYFDTIWRAMAYVTHYGSDSIEDMQDWEPSRIIRTLRHLSDIVKEENSPD